MKPRPWDRSRIVLASFKFYKLSSLLKIYLNARQQRQRTGGTKRTAPRVVDLTKAIEFSPWTKSIPVIGVDVSDSRYLPSKLIDLANRTSGIRLDDAICQRQMSRLQAAAIHTYMHIYSSRRYLIRNRSPLLHRQLVFRYSLTKADG